MTTSNLLKHTSHNPLQQLLIRNYYQRLIALLKKLPVVSILDAGCGEGFTLNRMRSERIGKQLSGIDNSTAALKLAIKIHPRFHYTAGNIYKLPYPAGKFDLVICTEVLEHLQYPVTAVNEVKRVSQKYCLFSVPHEPWFRLVNFFRGKYISTWGNHPENIQHWSKMSFSRLISQTGLKLIAEITAFPWLIILAKKNHSN